MAPRVTLPKASGGGAGSAGTGSGALMPSSRRTTASTRATWRGTRAPLPASAPAPASGGCCRPGGVRQDVRAQHCLTLQRSELRPRREGWAGGSCCPGSLTNSEPWASLCLRGFFQAGSTVHLIEPLDGGGEEGQHALYQAQHLQQKAGTCGVNDSSLEAVLGPRVSAALRPRVRGGPARCFPVRLARASPDSWVPSEAGALPATPVAGVGLGLAVRWLQSQLLSLRQSAPPRSHQGSPSTAGPAPGPGAAQCAETG